MCDPWASTIVEIYFDTHPHWVMDYGCYAVTIRCKGSLPLTVQHKLREIGDSLKGIAPQSKDAEALRRQHFAILDHCLDAGHGESPFADRKLAARMHAFLANYDHDDLRFDHWAVMPNHLHLTSEPFQSESAETFQTAWRRFKSRSARAINQAAGRTGSLWQSSWYDRWIRNPHEHERWQKYLRNKPFKAKLKDWPYVQ